LVLDTGGGAMTRAQAARLGMALLAWSRGAIVETRSLALPEQPWQPFTPGEKGWITVFSYQDWRIAPGSPCQVRDKGPRWWRKLKAWRAGAARDGRREK